MRILNFEFISNSSSLDIEAWIKKDEITKIIVWDDENARKRSLESLSIEEQEALTEEVWKRAVLEEQADEEERKRLREGFHKVWIEATSQDYAAWIKSKSL